MASICFYFQVHQPYRVKRYRVFDIGHDHDYFETDDIQIDNAKILKKVAQKCYLPANRVFLELLKKHKELKINFSFSGVFLEQIETYYPEVLESFQELVKTGQVEILSETYYHSLSFFYSLSEFEEQVELHKKLIKKIFNKTPHVFRNTELAYTNALALWAEKKGYKGILAEGWDPILGWRNPNFLYRPYGCSKIALFLKNYRLSDDIAFRFSDTSWKEHPLTVEKYSEWVNAINGNGNLINLFMDYETFGEHQWEEHGIFEFLRHLPQMLLNYPDLDFVTVSEAIDRYPVMDTVDVPGIVTWADTERDLTAWIGNDVQQTALSEAYLLENALKKLNDKSLLSDWRKLLTSDHFYYMCTKYFSDGDVHKYFSPYDSPYDAFIHYMNALTDLKGRIKRKNNRKKGLAGSSAQIHTK